MPLVSRQRLSYETYCVEGLKFPPEYLQQLNQMDRLETLQIDVVCDVSMFFCCVLIPLLCFLAKLNNCHILVKYLSCSRRLCEINWSAMEQRGQCSLEKFVTVYGGNLSALHGCLGQRCL